MFGLRPLHCHFSYLANKKTTTEISDQKRISYTRENERMSLVSSSNHQFSGDMSYVSFQGGQVLFFKCPIKKQLQKKLPTTMRIAKIFISTNEYPILWKSWLLNWCPILEWRGNMSNWFWVLSSGWLKDQTSHIGRFHDPIHLRVGFTSFRTIITTQNNKHWYFFWHLWQNVYLAMPMHSLDLQKDLIKHSSLPRPFHQHSPYGLSEPQVYGLMVQTGLPFQGKITPGYTWYFLWVTLIY